MNKIEEAQDILRTLGLPPRQQNKMSALTLLALCGVRPGDSWGKARREACTVTKGIMAFIAREYGEHYAPNTRETFRRQVLHQFVQARLADYNPYNPDLPTNSPRAHYALSEAALAAIRTYGTRHWSEAARRFVAEQGSLLIIYEGRKSAHQIAVHLPTGAPVIHLSPGKHNALQAAVVEQFLPRFAPGARLLYLGDTARKNLYLDAGSLAALNISLTEHDKLPDIVLHDIQRGWLFLVEAVTMHGPMTPKRVIELKGMFARSRLSLVLVSAFPDLDLFRRHLRDIAWGTEVWIAESADHLIHFNGDRFLGTRP